MLEALAALQARSGSGRPLAAAPDELECARRPGSVGARRTPRGRRILAAVRALALIGAFGLASCDTFLDTGSHTQRSAAMSVAFALQSGLGGDAQAFDKADAARIVLTRRGDGSTAFDETIDLAPSGGDIRTTLDLDLNAEAETFDLTVELMAGGQALFEGTTTVTLRVDETTSVEMSLDPVIASILIDPASITMTALGDSVVLDVVALFATEDTARSVRPTLTTLDAGIASVSGTTVKAVGEGATSVVAQSGSATQTIPVQVQATVASVSVSPESDTILVGDELQLTAGAHDANGHALVRTAAWSSSDPKVVTVDATGRVHALAVGRATVTAAVEGVHGQAVITVDPVPIPDVSLTVSVHGLGSVTSSDVKPAIACYADTCTETYPLGTQLTLTANQENPDFLFESWYGTGTGFTCTTSHTCVVTMDQDRTVTAWFSAPGIISVNPDSATFTMTQGGAPTPSSRAIKVSNIGERNVSISTATSYGQDVTPWLSATLDRTVVDTLNPATLTLSVMKNGLGPGTYTADVYVGSSFTGGTVHVTLTVEPPPTATLTVSVHGLGSVTSSGVQPAINCYADTCTETYPLGTQVTLTANDENPDFLWESWYGTGSGFTCTTSRTCVVTMDQDRTVTAWFSAPGIVSIDPDTASFTMAEGGTPVPSSHAITVSNIGERSVGISTTTSYSPNVTPWLSTSLDRTVVDTLTPATLTLSVMKNGLAPGTYTASVYVGNSFTGRTAHVTLRVLAPSPVISNVTAKLEQLNDSIICGYQTPHGSLFSFSFTYADPDGDVNQSTAVLTVDYQFSSGTTGQFKQPPEPGLFVGGDGFNGTITSYICNVFGSSTSVTETFTLQDAAGHASNSLSISVPRPEGAHIPPLGNAETQSNYSKKPKAEGARVTGG